VKAAPSDDNIWPGLRGDHSFKNRISTEQIFFDLIGKKKPGRLFLQGFRKGPGVVCTIVVKEVGKFRLTMDGFLRTDTNSTTGELRKIRSVEKKAPPHFYGCGNYTGQYLRAESRTVGTGKIN
jgi:hypothetical protein